MKWEFLTSEEVFERKMNRLCKWHTWFAWYPVRILDPVTREHCCVWLQTVGRRYTAYTKHSRIIADLLTSTRENKIGNKEHCLMEDLIVFALKDPEVRDERDYQIAGAQGAGAQRKSMLAAKGTRRWRSGLQSHAPPPPFKPARKETK